MQKIGGEVALRLGTGLLSWVDMWAREQQVTRAAAVRAILTQFATAHARAHGRRGADTIVDWHIVRPADGATVAAETAP